MSKSNRSTDFAITKTNSPVLVAALTQRNLVDFTVAQLFSGIRKRPGLMTDMWIQLFTRRSCRQMRVNGSCYAQWIQIHSSVSLYSSTNTTKLNRHVSLLPDACVVKHVRAIVSDWACGPNVWEFNTKARNDRLKQFLNDKFRLVFATDPTDFKFPYLVSIYLCFC